MKYITRRGGAIMAELLTAHEPLSTLQIATRTGLNLADVRRALSVLAHHKLCHDWNDDPIGLEAWVAADIYAAPPERDEPRKITAAALKLAEQKEAARG